MLSQSLRKAAVLISALDAEAADALLQQMSDDDAAKVRSAVVELDDIATEEQQQVLADFLREQGAGPMPASAGQDEVTLDLDPTVEAAAAATIADHPIAAPARPTEEAPSFAFLEQVDPKAIAVVLSRELPQTVAVVVAHLPPQLAAAVLQELPATLATDALARIAWIDEPAPEVQSDLIRELRQQLAPHIHTANAGATSLAHLTAVLGAMEYRQRQRVVLQLGKQNTPLLHRLGLFQADEAPAADRDGVIAMRYRLDSRPKAASLPPIRETTPPRRGDEPAWLAFDDFVQLDDAALRAV
ncbi:MAG TPA: hypothetical protein VKH44_15220, partial [Pirellulaceae bacterium]|nr:hypothetical protein [Pirellulaceae bacterium]